MLTSEELKRLCKINNVDLIIIIDIMHKSDAFYYSIKDIPQILTHYNILKVSFNDLNNMIITVY